jgi:hypothetical protein
MTKSILKTSTAIAVAVNVEYAIDAVLIAKGKAFLAADKTMQEAANSVKIVGREMAAMLYNRGWRAKDTKVSEDRRGYDAGKALFEQMLHTPELLAHLGKTSIYGAKVLLNFKGEIATDLNDGLEPKTRSKRDWDGVAGARWSKMDTLLEQHEISLTAPKSGNGVAQQNGPNTKRSLADRTYEEVKKLYDAQLAYDPKKHGELVYDVSEMRVLLHTVMILAKKGTAPAFK